MKEHGSFRNYHRNFGKLVFDMDEPFWNWFVHPLSGSQLFLYYRGRGYSSMESIAMSFVSTALFEFTIEIYTEPASIQDLYQTPIIGSLLGVVLETTSLYFLNKKNWGLRFIGHILNPTTFFNGHEAEVSLLPIVEKEQKGLGLRIHF